MARDIPEKVVDEAEAHVDILIHEEVSESDVQTDRVVTRSMKKRRHANSARGKFHRESKSVSEGVTHFSHWEDTTMSVKNCCDLPSMFLGVYALLSILVPFFIDVLHRLELL